MKLKILSLVLIAILAINSVDLVNPYVVNPYVVNNTGDSNNSINDTIIETINYLNVFKLPIAT
ncbi:MAG: hypothetical protein LBT10_03525, partial [Methanobrevibacter sp.]|nr:hypothetical protein [Methanobrevibacter sp.]